MHLLGFTIEAGLMFRKTKERPATDETSYRCQKISEYVAAFRTVISIASKCKSVLVRLL